MAGPEAPATGWLSRFEKELFTILDTKEEKNEAVLDFADAIANDFSRYPCFVGVTLRGSYVRGYGISSSDVDINVWYDSKDERYSVDDLDEMFGKLNILRRKYKLDAHIRWHDMSASESDISGFRRAYVGLCELTFGPRIEEYREKLGTVLKSLDGAKRSQILRNILVDLLYYETSRIPDMQDRIPELRNASTAELGRIMEKRKILWQERINSVFKLNAA